MRKVRKSPKRRVVRKSPKRRVVRKSPKRKVRKSPKRAVRRSRYGYGLGQPSLLNMMGPAGLTNNGIVVPTHYVGPPPLGPGGLPPKMM